MLEAVGGNKEKSFFWQRILRANYSYFGLAEV